MGLTGAAAIAHMRFDFIEKVCDETVIKPHESKEHLRSQKMDKILTGKYTAIPCFAGIMALVFLADLWRDRYRDFQIFWIWELHWLTAVVDQAMTAWNVNNVLHSLVIDGIFNGVGSVLSFLPIIVTLFFFLSLLEDSGYMAQSCFCNG